MIGHGPLSCAAQALASRLHARRPGGHAGRGEGHGLGSFPQQARDIGGGHMAFDAVGADHGRVASGITIWHAVAGADRGEIVAFDHLDGPSRAAHMRNPAVAASAPRRLVGDHPPILRERRTSECQSDGAAEQQTTVQWDRHQ